MQIQSLPKIDKNQYVENAILMFDNSLVEA
jgi:hypothetical protein